MRSIEIHKTADGSHTVWDASHGEHFHSALGAFGESMHVFIENGLNQAHQLFGNEINLLEIGFGTGLNALLTYLHRDQMIVHYTGVEKYPLPEPIWSQLAYEAFELEGEGNVYNTIMACEWESEHQIKPNFRLTKIASDLTDFEPEAGYYHLIYFDAFSASVQPELWSAEVFGKLYKALKPGGILVTYSAKGLVKQALRLSGFNVERLSGFAGKRHMLRAVKSL